jgi:hypothetical protein
VRAGEVWGADYDQIRPLGKKLPQAQAPTRIPLLQRVMEKPRVVPDRHLGVVGQRAVRQLQQVSQLPGGLNIFPEEIPVPRAYLKVGFGLASQQYVARLRYQLPEQIPDIRVPSELGEHGEENRQCRQALLAINDLRFSDFSPLNRDKRAKEIRLG